MGACRTSQGAEAGHGGEGSREEARGSTWGLSAFKFPMKPRNGQRGDLQGQGGKDGERCCKCRFEGERNEGVRCDCRKGPPQRREGYSPSDWMWRSARMMTEGGEVKALVRRGCSRVLALRARQGHLGFPPLPRFWPFLDRRVIQRLSSPSVLWYHLQKWEQ